MTDEVIGGFRLERLIGRGSTATVHLARPVNGIDRVVAVKRLTAPGSQAELQRIRSEAATMSRLDHPHIVRLFDIVEDGPGIALVMQYAPNGTLADRLGESGPLSPEELVRRIAPIADALASAHRRGVVHRDVKPSNILFTSDGDAMLGDFGIAEHNQQGMKHDIVALGTAEYLDPEVANGAHAGETADVYALGVVCYEALVGLAPFRGPTPAAVIETADRAAHDRLLVSVLGPIADVVEQAMSRRPADRFASAAAFAFALRSCVDGVEQRPPATPQPATAQPATAQPATAQPAKAQLAGFPDPAVVAAIQRVRPSTATAPVLPGTTSFQRPLGGRPNLTGAPTLNDAERRRKRLLAIAATTAVGVAATLGYASWRVTRAQPQESARVFRAVPCDRASALCVSEVVKIPGGLRVTFANQAEPVDYRVGDDDDALRVSNFFCGSTATLALYRPATGVVYYFKDWPRQVVGASPVPVLADRTGVRDANMMAADHTNDRCGDVGLTAGGVRTWFSPSRQPLRLENVTPTVEADADADADRSEAPVFTAVGPAPQKTE